MSPHGAPAAGQSTDAESTISHFFLAELLIDQKGAAEARIEFQRVVGAPSSSEWAPEDRDFKHKAAALFATLR